MAAPAVAVIGALAATPQVRSLVTSTPAATHTAAADRIGDPARAAVAAVGASSAHGAAYWAQHAKPGGARSAVSAAAAASKAAAARHARAAASASPSPSPSSSPTSSAGTTGTTGTSGGAPSCTGPVTGPVPENYAAIVDFLVAHGYSDNAAAGIAGNIYQESGGNPESGGDGGGGLIGWTPLPSGLITGNASADLQTQLEAVLTFDDNWSQYLPALNDASTPAAAADVYVTDFERAGVPAAGTREAAADAVATACHL
jgi:Phage tail lysozyme